MIRLLRWLPWVLGKKPFPEVTPEALRRACRELAEAKEDQCGRKCDVCARRIRVAFEEAKELRQLLKWRKQLDNPLTWMMATMEMIVTLDRKMR